MLLETVPLILSFLCFGVVMWDWGGERFIFFLRLCSVNLIKTRVLHSSRGFLWKIDVAGEKWSLSSHVVRGGGERLVLWIFTVIRVIMTRADLS